MPFLIPDDRLLAMLREDAPYGDATTLGLGIADRQGRAVFRTRSTITACCIEEAERIMLLAGCSGTRRHASSGSQIEAPPAGIAAFDPGCTLLFGIAAEDAMITHLTGG